jgi:hypothetical protein
MLAVMNILHNVNTNTYHPCYYYEAPMPGGKSIDEQGFLRYKSKGHHTSGFDTLEKAQEAAKNLLPHLDITERSYDERPMEWDGELALVLIVDNFISRPDGKFKAF